MQTSETYITRPKTKPDSSQKGKLNSWSNGYAEFVPQGSRETQRQMLRQLGDSSFYKTEGKKESSFSLHLNVDGENPDPVNEMFELFKALTEGQRKQEPKLDADEEGKMLYDDGHGLQVWLDTKHHEVKILTRLTCSLQIERQLLQAEGQMNVTIARHRQEIVNLVKINNV